MATELVGILLGDADLDSFRGMETRSSALLLAAKFETKNQFRYPQFQDLPIKSVAHAQQ